MTFLPRRWMASRSPDRRPGRTRLRRGLRRRRPWHCARPRRAAPGCRSSDICAPGNNRARLRGSRRAAAGRPCLQRHPDAAVVAQRLAHQSELGLIVAGDRNAGGMDLREAGIGEQGAASCGRARWPWRCSPWRWWRGNRRCRSRRCRAPRRRPACDSILPVIRSRVTMPRARPSTTTRSSISVRGYICTCPRRSAARAPGRRPAAVAGRSGRARRRCARPARRRRSGCPASRRIRGRRARPALRTDR